jgi:nicotinamide riboside kinase
MVETNIKPIIIQDSNLITTAVYYKLLFNELPTEIENNIKYENNKIYFLFKNDNKFIEDTHRIISKEEEFRNKWFSVCEDFLKHYNITYIIVEGNFKQKEEKIMNYFSSII